MVKSFKIKILAYLIFTLQWLIFLSCKKEYFGELKNDNKPLIILFYHGKLFLLPFVLNKWFKNRKIFVMISNHKDGELVAQDAKFFGMNTIRGSTRNGAFGLVKQAFKVLDDQNCVAITPDGPKGPYHHISDGSVVLSQKKSTQIVLLNYEASSCWEFKSWDKMILPKPFSTIRYRLSESICVNNLSKDEAKQKIKENFDKILQIDSFNQR